MRILLANDGLGDAGGVNSYLEAVARGLSARGHELAFIHCDANTAGAAKKFPAGMTLFRAGEDARNAFERARKWSPDLCFSHNMNRLDLEEMFQQAWPVVKLMHGYFGTCAAGLKTHSTPSPRPCERQFGPACLALYLPRRCGQLLPGKMISQYRWAARQKSIFGGYAAVVVASRHMWREYVANGAPAERIYVVPLFPTRQEAEPLAHEGSGAVDRSQVLFLGRMTKLKGGDLLIRAAAKVERLAGFEVSLLMAGDGPQRPEWEALAHKLGVRARFVGWINNDRRDELLRESTLLAVPSVWPEPFGLVGLEAAQAGIPAVAFDVGGISEWLKDGVNGVLARATPPNSRNLAAALIEVLGNRERLRLMGLEARRIAREMSLDKHLGHLEEIFANVLTESAAQAAGLNRKTKTA